MPRRYTPRRWFTAPEVERMRRMAEAGKSQTFAAAALGRDPGVIAGAAIRYGIQFSGGPGGRPRRADPVEQRQRRAENCRRYRRRKAGKPVSDIRRFDDPRAMIPCK